MLRLRHRHAVARHDDDRAGVLHDESGVLGRAGAHRLVAAGAATYGPRDLAAEAAEDDVEDRAVHPLAHDVAEDGARRSHQRAGDDQQAVLQREADAGRGPARIAVQHGDDDRHVGAADRQDQEEADQQRQDDNQPEGPDRLVHAEPDDQTDQRDAQRRVQRVLHREDQRLAGDQALELTEGDDRAGEGDRADGDAKAHLDQAGDLDLARCTDVVGLRRVERGRRHQHRCQAHQAVEGRDQLRQRRHLDLKRDHRTDGAADDDAEQDQPVGDDARERQRRDHGDRHADDAVEIAAARGLRRGEAAERHDEADGGRKVEQRRERGRHERGLPNASS